MPYMAEAVFERAELPVELEVLKQYLTCHAYTVSPQKQEACKC